MLHLPETKECSERDPTSCHLFSPQDCRRPPRTFFFLLLSAAVGISLVSQLASVVSSSAAYRNTGRSVRHGDQSILRTPRTNRKINVPRFVSFHGSGTVTRISWSCHPLTSGALREQPCLGWSSCPLPRAPRARTLSILQPRVSSHEARCYFFRGSALQTHVGHAGHGLGGNRGSFELKLATCPTSGFTRGGTITPSYTRCAAGSSASRKTGSGRRCACVACISANMIHLVRDVRSLSHNPPDLSLSLLDRILPPVLKTAVIDETGRELGTAPGKCSQACKHGSCLIHGFLVVRIDGTVQNINQS